MNAKNDQHDRADGTTLHNSCKREREREREGEREETTQKKKKEDHKKIQNKK